MGVKVVSLSLIDVRGIRKAVTPEVGTVLGSAYWWNVHEFDTGELNGRIERAKMYVICFQNGGGDVGN